MKKSKLVVMITIILSFSIIFNGCSDEKKSNISPEKQVDDKTQTTVNILSKEQTNTTMQTATILTLDDIKKRYGSDEIKNIININTEYVLVESRKETFANRFVLYNLKTGAFDELPTRPEYVTLEKIENENYFIFLSSGKNSESPFGTFPYLVKCFRIKNGITKNDSFIAVHEDRYFGIDEPVQSGNKDESLMSDLNITFDGLEVLFKPITGKEGDFYAGITDIPTTKTSYEKNKNQLTFEIEANQLSEKLKNLNEVNTDNNQFISSYEITQEDNKIQLAVNLRDSAKRYLIKKKQLPNGFTYFSVEFTGGE